MVTPVPKPALSRRTILKTLTAMPASLLLASGRLGHGAERPAILPASRTEWMKRGSYGVMAHWLVPGCQREKGPPLQDFNQAVNAFDRDRFLQDFQRTGADWLIFTIGQNTSYYASPNAVLDRLAGPGHCSQRDLVFEIARCIHQLGKRFIAYLPCEVSAPTSLHAAFGWNPRKDQTEFERRYTSFIREYAVRYGAYLDGWWFDGCYGWDVFPNSTYHWPMWFDAARAGNPEAVVAFNDGSFCAGVTRPVTPLQDYLSGEVEELIDGKIRLGRQTNAPLHLPNSRFVPGTTCQWHALVPIDCLWIHGEPGPMPPPKYSDGDLLRFLLHCRAVGGAATLNVGMYQEGHMAPKSVAQLAHMASALKKP
jgi:hypothetical protein